MQQRCQVAVAHHGTFKNASMCQLKISIIGFFGFSAESYILDAGDDDPL